MLLCVTEQWGHRTAINILYYDSAPLGSGHFGYPSMETWAIKMADFPGRELCVSKAQLSTKAEKTVLK